MFMNFFVFPHEIQKIIKRGGGGGDQKKLWGAVF